MPKTPTVIIETSKGIVSDVISDTNLNVMVIDRDNLDPTSDAYHNDLLGNEGMMSTFDVTASEEFDVVKFYNDTISGSCECEDETEEEDCSCEKAA